MYSSTISKFDHTKDLQNQVKIPETNVYFDLLEVRT